MNLPPKKPEAWDTVPAHSTAATARELEAFDDSQSNIRHFPDVADVEYLQSLEDLEAQNARQTQLDELLANVRSGTWLDAQSFPELSYAIPGVIPEGFTVIAGAPKVGKSWLILSLCLALSAGTKALGALPVEPGRVFYLALEDGDRRLQDRIRQLTPGAAIPERFNYVTKVDPGRILMTISAFVERYPDTVLVVLDTLGKVMPSAAAGETTYQRDYRVGSGLKNIVDAHPGLALVVVHHDRKADTGDFVDAVSGTNGIAGSADTIVLLSRDRHAEVGLLNVTGRDVLEAEYGLTRSPSGSWSLTGGDLDSSRAAAAEHRQALALDRQGDRMREVVQLVSSSPEGITPKDVDAQLGMTGQAKVYLARAAAAGLIDKSGRGHYLPLTPPVTSVTVLPSSDEFTTEVTGNRSNSPQGES